MALSASELKEMQRRQWGIDETGTGPVQKKKPAIKTVPVRKPNKYLNIIRGDIDYLTSILSGSYSPVGWVRKWLRKRGEYRDFMEQHFGRKRK